MKNPNSPRFAHLISDVIGTNSFDISWMVVWCLLPMHHCKTLPIAIFSLILGGISLVPWSQLHAGASNKSGNPFGYGTFFQGGTFSAVIRGQNLSGTMLVSAPPGASTGNSNSSPTNGSGGMATIIFQGNTFQANADASVNPSSSQIAGNFYGGITLSGNGSNTVLASTTNPLTPVVSNTNLFATNYTFSIYYITNVVPYITSTTNWSNSYSAFTNTNPVVTVSTNSNPEVTNFTNNAPVVTVTTNSNPVITSYTNQFPVVTTYTNYTYTYSYSTNSNPVVTTYTNYTYTYSTSTNSNPVVTTYTNLTYGIVASTTNIPIVSLVTNAQVVTVTNVASSSFVTTNYFPNFDTNGSVIGYTTVLVTNAVAPGTNNMTNTYVNASTNLVPQTVLSTNTNYDIKSFTNNFPVVTVSTNTNYYIQSFTNNFPVVIVSTNTNYSIQSYTNTNPQVYFQTNYTYTYSHSTNTNPVITTLTNYTYTYSYSTNSNPVVTVVANSNPVVTYTTNTNPVEYELPNGNNASNYTISSFTNTNSISLYSTNVMMTNYLNLQKVATTTYNDAVQFIGAYAGPLKNQYPNQTFLGNGAVTQKQLSFSTDGIPTVQMQNYPISVQGILISANMQTFPTYSNSVPFATTIYRQTNLTTSSQ